jgi:hypothetical protein
MKSIWIAIAAVALTAGVAVVAADSAQAKPKKKIVRVCADPPRTFTFGGLLFNPAPQPNGCSPAVYARGRYVGQDPDPFIRSQLLRDPDTGYSPQN